MGRLRRNALIKYISGKVGDYVYRRRGNKTIVCRPPKERTTPFTEAEEAKHNRFREAHKYGNLVKEDPVRRAPYERTARKEGRSIYHLALSDYMVSPTVEQVDFSGYTGSSGDLISIEATDNVEVARVNVVLTHDDGDVIEEGEAVMECRGCWTYVATQSVPKGATVRIVATAIDRPGWSDVLEAVATV